MIQPWRLLADPSGYIFTWLLGYSGGLGSIAGVLIADYWIVRRTELDVGDLYRPTGRYRGINRVAILALVLGIIPNVPGFLKSAHVIGGAENIFDTIYVYAWFIGFLVAGSIYLAGMSLAPTSSRPGAAGIAPSS